MMTPYTIGILLHVYAIPTTFFTVPPSPALKDTLKLFEAEDLIKFDPDMPCGWRITPKGTHHVEALCSLPFPEAKWITPGTTYMEGDS
jgi:hypothetical protein